MTIWTRRAFDAPGLTQHPVGPHLAAVQQHLGGAVVLCLDVSGSMGGTLQRAVRGCRRFVDEALSRGYEVAVALWDGEVAGSVGPAQDAAALNALLDGARVRGGTDVVPALLHSRRMLDGRSGDRVIAIFGDGDLGDEEAAKRLAATLRAEGIRIITCGLGEASARELAAISTEFGRARPRDASGEGVESAIAGMAAGLRRTSSP